MNVEEIPDLPELPDDRVEAIEQRVFTAIDAERVQQRARSARRRRAWTVGGVAAAAVIVAAAVVAPGITSSLSSTAANEAAVAPDMSTEEGMAPAAGDGVGEPDAFLDSDSTVASDELKSAASPTDGRDIITSATATVEVDDVAVAARTIGNSAAAHGGYVESMNIDSTTPAAVPGGPAVDMYYPMPYSSSWVTVRVPSDQLTEVMTEVSDVGEVTATSVNRQDVTTQTVDLEARIAASQASVERVQELLAQAQDLSDILTAEQALAERQAQLESYQQQLVQVQSMVDLSTLTVTLVAPAEAVTADPAGFADGWSAGWASLILALNGLVIGLGFVLPWVFIVAVLGGLVWLIVRAARRRKTKASDVPGDDAGAPPTA